MSTNTESKGTVLIVDDDISLRAVIAMDFKNWGYHVLTASGGDEAFEIIKRELIDLVLSDIRMPKGAGTDLLRKIKELNIEVPTVLLMTGFADISLEEAYNMGAEAVFSKPFDRKELLRSVQRLMVPKTSVWQKRAERVDVDLNVELTYSNLQEAISAHVLNIGRGGMFVAMSENLPRNHTEISFKVLFQGDASSELQGHGVVRWVRPEGSENSPAGFGLEFLFLDDQSKLKIFTILENLKTRAYIPKN